jgi:hypothetical protein
LVPRMEQAASRINDSRNFPLPLLLSISVLSFGFMHYNVAF